MIEYTSLDVSRRLAEAGFKEEAGDVWREALNHEWNVGRSRYVDGDFRAYRADTLMEWLITRGDWDISIGKPHDKVLIDAASMKLQKRFAVEADAIPDALGEVVLAVLAKEAEHDKQG